jgi:hypothetical protein
MALEANRNPKSSQNSADGWEVLQASRLVDTRKRATQGHTFFTSPILKGSSSQLESLGCLSQHRGLDLFLRVPGDGIVWLSASVARLRTKPDTLGEELTRQETASLPNRHYNLSVQNAKYVRNSLMASVSATP